MTIIIAILFQGCGFQKWETKDKLLFTSFAGLQAVDTAQSWNIWDDPDRTELNPLITSQEGLVAIKLLSTGAIYLLADYFEDGRTTILTVGNILVSGVVVWNITQ